MAARAVARSSGSARSVFWVWAWTSGSGSVPGPGRARPKVKNCILIWLAGGPSHLDTFDPKPNAPADVRGEFKPIATSVPGLQISEVLPNLAKVMNRVTLIRSMTSPESDHGRASHHLLTGYRPSPALEYPGYGSVVAKAREAKRGMLPPYVAVPDAPISGLSGYLTPAYDPFAVSGDPNQAGFRVRNLTPPDRLTLARLMRRRDMVKSLDEFSRDVPATSLTTSRDQFSEQAYSLLTSSAAQAAFRMNEESDSVREKYGRTTFGQSCLLARRLVEAGVSFVTLNDRRDRPARLGHPRPELPDHQEHAGASAGQGGRGAGRGPHRAGTHQRHAGRHDGRVRPDAQDQQATPAATITGGPTASCSSGRGLPRGSSWAGPTPAATYPPNVPSLPPTWPGSCTTNWGSTRPPPGSRPPTDAPSAWSTRPTRREN